MTTTEAACHGCGNHDKCEAQQAVEEELAAAREKHQADIFRLEQQRTDANAELAAAQTEIQRLRDMLGESK